MSGSIPGSGPDSEMKSLSSTPSGKPAAAASLSGSGGSKRITSAARIEVGTVTMTRRAVTVPRVVSSRIARPPWSMRDTAAPSATGRPFGELLEQPAIALAQPPIDPAVLVADVVLDRDAVELGAVPPAAGRVEQLVPAPARRQQARQRAVDRLRCGSAGAPGLALRGSRANRPRPRRSRRCGAAASSIPAAGDGPRSRALGRSATTGCGRPNAAIRRRGRAETRPARSCGRGRRPGRAPRAPEPRPRPLDQPPRRADPGGAGADHRDIDLRSECRHTARAARRADLGGSPAAISLTSLLVIASAKE